MENRMRRVSLLLCSMFAACCLIGCGEPPKPTYPTQTKSTEHFKGKTPEGVKITEDKLPP
jgi:hypothetical protein